MRIERLRLQQFRCFAQTEFRPEPGFNLLIGQNGGGKTSVLEALHLLAHGRSFRGRVRDGLVRRGQPALELLVDWQTEEAASHRAGLRHTGSQWQARLDGQEVQQLGQLVAALAVISFEPGSHALVDGGSETRRRYLDWGLFHVEQDFLLLWRQYARALKQRNALLRQPGSRSQLDGWEHEMVRHGEVLTRQREAYVAGLQASLAHSVEALLPELGSIELHLHPGWKTSALGLGDALLLARERDFALGHTTVGPHRADLRISLGGLPTDCLSRGQTKQLALALVLAQARQLAGALGHWPVLQLDDLAAELDRPHQERVLAELDGCGAQVLITGTECPVVLADRGEPLAVFHVEHGEISRAV